MTTNILLVTDEPEMGRFWSYVLQQRNLACTVTTGSEEALPRWRELAPSLSVIDLHSPDAKPIHVCRALRQQVGSPILLLWEAPSEAVLLEAYHAGADEVVERPVGPQLLMAKIEAWLRHASCLPLYTPDVIERQGLRLTAKTHTLTLQDGSAVRLSALEARLLSALMLQPRRVLSAESLLAHVWEHDGADPAQLKNVVYRLRRKIEPNPHRPRYIHTVEGQGYSFDVS